MSLFHRLSLFSLLGLLLLTACSSEPQPSSLVVTSSSLRAVCERLLEGAEVEVISLHDGEQCPFGLVPEGAARSMMKETRVVFFQEGQSRVFEQMARWNVQRFHGVPAVSGSLLVPEGWAVFVESVMDHLAVYFPEYLALLGDNAQKLLEENAERARDLQKQAASWQGRKVIAALHQADFCRYLGLEVVGTLQQEGGMTQEDLDALLEAEADLVVGNLQDGNQAAQAVSRRMELPLAVLSQYPDAPGYGRGYGDLIAANMTRLKKALHERGQP